jgi:hypothetical protein
MRQSTARMKGSGPICVGACFIGAVEPATTVAVGSTACTLLANWFKSWRYRPGEYQLPFRI